MSLPDELKSAVLSAANNPKVAASVTTATTSLGFASITDLISGALALAAMIAGLIVTVLLGRVHWASYKTQSLHNMILRRQLRELGGDPDRDEE
jgi:hypothetical protein